ncbi:hypothetical protein H9W95_04005 [Flavobacterium lindanitolerans]|nr:hypothetical protein [Flavobacterium lindanitolerans]
MVTQTQGCNATAEKVFVLEYPTGFEVTIAPTTNYTACDNGPVTLSVTRFIANTSQGTIDLTNRNNSAYTYQWFKNTSTITGATGTSHTINSATENGSYTVSITLPDFAPVVSNAVDIKLSPKTQQSAVPERCAREAVLPFRQALLILPIPTNGLKTTFQFRGLLRTAIQQIRKETIT